MEREQKTFKTLGDVPKIITLINEAGNTIMVHNTKLFSDQMTTSRDVKMKETCTKCGKQSKYKLKNLQQFACSLPCYKMLQVWVIPNGLFMELVYNEWMVVNHNITRIAQSPHSLWCRYLPSSSAASPSLPCSAHWSSSPPLFSCACLLPSFSKVASSACPSSSASQI